MHWDRDFWEGDHSRQGHLRWESTKMKSNTTKWSHTQMLCSQHLPLWLILTVSHPILACCYFRKCGNLSHFELCCYHTYKDGTYIPDLHMYLHWFNHTQSSDSNVDQSCLCWTKLTGSNLYLFTIVTLLDKVSPGGNYLIIAPLEHGTNIYKHSEFLGDKAAKKHVNHIQILNINQDVNEIVFWLP